MNDNLNMINVGTQERPVMVPEKALKPNTDEGNDWWEMLASGSVVLPDEDLETLLKAVKNENH
jgi:hypothetical protein